MDPQIIRHYTDQLNSSMDIEKWSDLSEEAAGEKVPAVRDLTAKLLYFLAALSKPGSALEIGTGSGLSTLWIRRGLPENCRLLTLERDKNRYLKARELFRDYPGIEILYRDAFDYLDQSTEIFDFVFLDAQKRDYPAFLKALEGRLAGGGILIADNFLFGGKAAGNESGFPGGVELLRSFNEELSKNRNFISLFLPVEDGIAMAIRK